MAGVLCRGGEPHYRDARPKEPSSFLRPSLQQVPRASQEQLYGFIPCQRMGAS